MQARHLTKLYVADDGSDYGTLGGGRGPQAAAPAGRPVRRLVAAAGADAVFYGGTPGGRRHQGPGRGRRGQPERASCSRPRRCTTTRSSPASAPARSALYVSSPGFTSARLSARRQGVRLRLCSAYGHRPRPRRSSATRRCGAAGDADRRAGANANSRALAVARFRALHSDRQVGARDLLDQRAGTPTSRRSSSRIPRAEGWSPAACLDRRAPSRPAVRGRVGDGGGCGSAGCWRCSAPRSA